MSTFTIPVVVPGAKARTLSRRARLTISRTLVLLVLAGGWQLLYVTKLLPEVAPDIVQIIVALYTVVSTGAFWVAVGQTLFGAFSGLVIAAVVGIVLGIAIGTNGFLSRSVEGIVEFGRAFPTLALMPVVVLVIGVNTRMEILMVFLSCLWPILIQSIAGSRRQDQAVADTVAVFRIAPMRRFWRVTIPSAMPLISTGLRISASISILVAVGVGVLSQTPGLGRQITLAQEASRWDVAFAYIIFAGLVGWLLNSAIAAVEAKALKWNRQEI